MKIRKLETLNHALEYNHVNDPAVLGISKTKALNCHYNQHEPSPQLEDQRQYIVCLFVCFSFKYTPTFSPFPPITLVSPQGSPLTTQISKNKKATYSIK